MTNKKTLITIGIDEVGRGALAGPVTVAALALPNKFKTKNLKLKAKLKDSKKLTPEQREVWFDFIKQQKIPCAIADVSPKIIDKINISNAANTAATKAFQKLLNNNAVASLFSKRKTIINVFLDGGLYLNKKIPVAIGYTLNPKTIIRGDEKIPAISLASIVAKITRDRYMKKLHKKYPRYDFVHNVGYGVKKHIKAIKKFGHSPVHRKSFKIKPPNGLGKLR